jgi:hypothetical protein
MPLISRTTTIATAARVFMHPKWIAWRADRDIMPVAPQSESTGMCRFSACFLQQLLAREIPEGHWVLEGGYRAESESQFGPSRIAGGYFDATTRRWNGHYWLVEKKTGMVVDVTADQFDGAPVTVCREPWWKFWRRRRYHATYSAQEIAEHLADDMKVAAVWLAEWDATHTTTQGAEVWEPPVRHGCSQVAELAFAHA